MKKFLFFCAASLVAMVACNKTEQVAPQTENAPKAIQFRNYLARPTKADVVDITYLKNNGFYVAAQFGTAEYFAATKVNHEASVNTISIADYFVPTPARYWPLDFDSKTLTFYAANDANITSTGAVSFETNTDIASMVDLVTAYKVEATSIITDAGDGDFVTDTDKQDGCVDLRFEHALVKVNFTLKGLDADLDGGYQYTISSLTVGGIDTKATYTISNTWATGTTGKPGSWGSSNTPEDIVYCSPVYFTYDKTATGISDYVAGTTYGYVMNENLMIIPQDGNFNADGTDATVTTHIKCNIKYSVRDKNNNLLADFTTEGRDFYIPVSVTNGSATGKWTDQGKAFRYIIEIPAGTKPITFAAVVGDWAEELSNTISL